MLRISLGYIEHYGINNKDLSSLAHKPGLLLIPGSEFEALCTLAFGHQGLLLLLIGFIDNLAYFSFWLSYSEAICTSVKM